jgi:hypothetical protein
MTSEHAIKRLLLPVLLGVCAATAGAANLPPFISGRPGPVIPAGTIYRFVPAAVDLNHDALAYSIANKPPWAAFNIATGELTGVPANSQSGTYDNVVISVTDGQSMVALPAFSIVVVPSGSATVSWTAPQTNTDGSALTDLAGYKLYFMQLTWTQPQVVSIDGPDRLSYTLGGLSPGVYLFSVSAFNSMHVESDPSPSVAKIVP